ncbi:hypothetical protein SRABI128_06141 [Microbacterium sp. Bi128]|nr:hypothetical protein SRABI128_06141 [Microbacterium sp. Bi128]
MGINDAGCVLQDCLDLRRLLPQDCRVQAKDPDGKAAIGFFADPVDALLRVGGNFAGQARVACDHAVDGGGRVRVGRVRGHGHPQLAGADVTDLIRSDRAPDVSSDIGHARDGAQFYGSSLGDPAHFLVRGACYRAPVHHQRLVRQHRHHRTGPGQLGCERQSGHRQHRRGCEYPPRLLRQPRHGPAVGALQPRQGTPFRRLGTDRKDERQCRRDRERHDHRDNQGQQIALDQGSEQGAVLTGNKERGHDGQRHNQQRVEHWRAGCPQGARDHGVASALVL